MATLGERLRDLISERDLTQREVSVILGIKPSTIHGYITNDRRPDIEMQKRIAEYFGVSLDYLTGYSDKRYTVEEGAPETNLSHLSEELNAFVANPDNKEFIRISKLIMDKGIKPDVLKEFITEVNPANLKKYVRLIKIIEKKGIDPDSIDSFKMRVKL